MTNLEGSMAMPDRLGRRASTRRALEHFALLRGTRALRSDPAPYVRAIGGVGLPEALGQVTLLPRNHAAVDEG